MNSIFSRRSIRRYKDTIVEKEKIEKILRAAMQAPSAWNQQPWEFIVVENKDKLQELSKLSPYASSIAHSPVSIVILGNENRMVIPEQWEQDLGAATQNMLLEAVELGLGAVWLGVYPKEDIVDFVTNSFKLPKNIKPYAVISIGYPLEGKGNKFIDRYDESRVHYENY